MWGGASGEGGILRLLSGLEGTHTDECLPVPRHEGQDNAAAVSWSIDGNLLAVVFKEGEKSPFAAGCTNSNPSWIVRGTVPAERCVDLEFFGILSGSTEEKPSFDLSLNSLYVCGDLTVTGTNTA